MRSASWWRSLSDRQPVQATIPENLFQSCQQFQPRLAAPGAIRLQGKLPQGLVAPHYCGSGPCPRKPRQRLSGLEFPLDLAAQPPQTSTRAYRRDSLARQAPTSAPWHCIIVGAASTIPRSNKPLSSARGTASMWERALPAKAAPAAVQAKKHKPLWVGLLARQSTRQGGWITSQGRHRGPGSGELHSPCAEYNSAIHRLEGVRNQPDNSPGRMDGLKDSGGGAVKVGRRLTLATGAWDLTAAAIRVRSHRLVWG